MPIIRRNYHYGAYYLDPDPLDTKALGGRTLDVKLKDGFERIYFAGFLHIHSVDELCKPVKIINVSKYTNASTIYPDRWLEYCAKTVLLGAYLSNEGVWLCINTISMEPFAWCELPKAQVTHANSPHRTRQCYTDPCDLINLSD